MKSIRKTYKVKNILNKKQQNICTNEDIFLYRENINYFLQFSLVYQKLRTDKTLFLI